MGKILQKKRIFIVRLFSVSVYEGEREMSRMMGLSELGASTVMSYVLMS